MKPECIIDRLLWPIVKRKSLYATSKAVLMVLAGAALISVIGGASYLPCTGIAICCLMAYDDLERSWYRREAALQAWRDHINNQLLDAMLRAGEEYGN